MAQKRGYLPKFFVTYITISICGTFHNKGDINDCIRVTGFTLTLTAGMFGTRFEIRGNLRFARKLTEFQVLATSIAYA